MAKANVFGIISSNLVIASSLLFLTQCGETVIDQLDITSHPLFATKVYIVTIALLNVACAWLQGARPLRPANAGVSAMLTCASALAFHLIAVVFGAPFLSEIQETFHFACLLSSAAILPSFIVLGPYQDNWVQVFAQHNPDPGAETNLWTSTACCVLGAWLGAIPIPLDWDRPWQKWPITCIYGSIYGYIIGLVVSSIYVYYQDRWGEKSKVL